MNKKIFYSLLGLMLAVAASLRFYKLGLVPHGMTWDEAAIGYNGFAIFHTRRDEWLQRLPVSFRSFGDYKAPLAIYLNGFFTAIFGMNLWAVRLPFTLASIAAIAGMMLLTEKISQKKWALVAGVIMTFSPWHIHYSRAGFESGISLSFLIWSLYFLFTYLKLKQKKVWCLGLAAILAVASMYTYHSAKLVVPVTILVILVWYQREMMKKIWFSLITGALSLIFILPMIWDSVKGHGLERLGTTVVDEFSGLRLVVTVWKQFLAHLVPQFLIMGQTTTLRHGDGVWGVLLPTTFMLVIAGFIYGLHFFKAKKNHQEIFYLGLILILVGLMPAALGEEIPHSNRSLLALPGFILLAVYGLENLVNQIKKMKLNHDISGTRGQKNIILKLFLGLLILFHSLFFITYLAHYFTGFAADSAPAFKDGYSEAFEYIVPYEDQVEKILFTSDYGQPYIYALFVRKTNPIWYRGGSLIKYEFTDEIYTRDLARKNTIVVASNKDEVNSAVADKLIYGSDGKIRFKIYLPKEQ